MVLPLMQRLQEFGFRTREKKPLVVGLDDQIIFIH